MCPSTNESLGCLSDDIVGSIGCESQREAGGIQGEAPGRTQTQEGDLIAAVYVHFWCIEIGLVTSDSHLGQRGSGENSFRIDQMMSSIAIDYSYTDKMGSFS